MNAHTIAKVIATALATGRDVTINFSKTADGKPGRITVSHEN